ncbi:MAG: hypothetical protein Q9163_005510 [Psora crenata]
MVIVSVLRLSIKFYQARSRISRLRKQGLPMPPWHPLFGHLLFLRKILSTLPKDAHFSLCGDIIKRLEPDLGPIYYLDMWPAGPQLLFVNSVHGLYQIMQQHPLRKHKYLGYFLNPIAEGLGIPSMEGDMWRTWRNIFNPAFSVSNIMTMTSSLVAETNEFCAILEKCSQEHKIVRMKDLIDKLVFDLAGRLVFGKQLYTQKRRNPLLDGMRSQTPLCTFGPDPNPIRRYNPVRQLLLWYNSRRMNNFVSKEIDSQFAQYQCGVDHDLKGSKSIIDLIFNAYLLGNPARKSQAMDSKFKKYALNQVKMMMFSGFGTTSGMISCLFYVLSRNPAVLARVRAEHAEFTGPDVSQTASLITANPYLLNKLPYTVAVIKETMRMYPTISANRGGEPLFDVTDDLGRRFPTDGLLLMANSHTIHRDPAYWLRPDDFLPERWLVGLGDPLYPVKGAWRPFEHGPRNCIAQELVVHEMKIVMVMVLRRFDVKPAYDELDRARGAKGIRTVHGERGYQVQMGEPNEQLPCRVAVAGS